jgi:hypothetical protein
VPPEDQIRGGERSIVHRAAGGNPLGIHLFHEYMHMAKKTVDFLWKTVLTTHHSRTCEREYKRVSMIFNPLSLPLFAQFSPEP